MTLIPHQIDVIATKADGTANTGKTVWFTNETTNEIKTEVTDSEGHTIFDCANYSADYSNGDVLTVTIEAYETPGFYLVKDAFEDTSVDTIEFNDQRLNTATLTVNFKIVG